MVPRLASKDHVSQLMRRAGRGTMRGSSVMRDVELGHQGLPSGHAPWTMVLVGYGGCQRRLVTHDSFADRLLFLEELTV